jgi:Ser/Thr protein kinase RdoA (MazF antagonist)
MRPELGADEARHVAATEFGINVSQVKALDSYDDQNFLLTVASGEQYVLKISNTDFSPDGLEMQNAALLALHGEGLKVPCPVTCTSGENICKCVDSSGRSFDVRLVTFLPGKLMGHAKKSYSVRLLQQLGQTAGKVHGAN